MRLSGPWRFAISTAAQTPEPLLPPQSIPSWRIKRRAIRNDSRSSDLIHSSTTSASRTSGMKS